MSSVSKKVAKARASKLVIARVIQLYSSWPARISDANNCLQQPVSDGAVTGMADRVARLVA